MVDLLGAGRAWLNETRRASMTRTVSYQRGSASVDVLATPGDEALLLDGEALPGRYFKLGAADLVIGGFATLPAIGDRIVDTAITYHVIAGREQVYVADRRGFLVHAFDPEQIGEQVTYYPDGNLYDPRSIRAVLKRSPPDVIPTASGAEFLALAWRIFVPRGSLPDFRPHAGLDLIELPLQIGDPTHLWKRLRIDRLLEQDHPGFWGLGIVR